MTMYDGYCVKCREKREFDGKEVTLANGRRGAHGLLPHMWHKDEPHPGQGQVASLVGPSGPAFPNGGAGAGLASGSGLVGWPARPRVPRLSMLSPWAVQRNAVDTEKVNASLTGGRPHGGRER